MEINSSSCLLLSIVGLPNFDPEEEIFGLHLQSSLHNIQMSDRKHNSLENLLNQASDSSSALGSAKQATFFWLMIER